MGTVFEPALARAISALNQTGTMRAFKLSEKYLSTRARAEDVDGLHNRAHTLTPSPLSREEITFATTAWDYFLAQCDHSTGFAGKTPVDPTMTPWEMGSVIMANVCADRLGLAGNTVIRSRLALCLNSLARLPLANRRLPNIHYRPDSLKMLTGKGRITLTGVGWSPVRIFRLVSSLIILAHHFPDFAPEIALILRRWHLGELIKNGRFLAARHDADGQFIKSEQGVLGYEQYAARAACLIALPAENALDMRMFLRAQWYNGLLLPGDKRRINGRAPVITSEPFCLEALEFGWREDLFDVTASLYLAQKGRFEQTGHLTALTEDALDRPPGFAFHGVLAGQQPFTSFSADGQDLSHLRCLSTKSAFCWWALLRTPYSQKLLDGVADLTTDQGWYTGRYETDGQINRALSLNTNAVILEALHYKTIGPLFPTP